jgi:hypothetical protein
MIACQAFLLPFYCQFFLGKRFLLEAEADGHWIEISLNPAKKIPSDPPPESLQTHVRGSEAVCFCPTINATGVNIFQAARAKPR